MTLTDEQLQAIESGEPVSVLIEQTRCIVLREDLYQRVQEALEQDHDELRAIFARSVESSDWNDPAMDVYRRQEQPRHEEIKPGKTVISCGIGKIAQLRSGERPIRSE